MEDAEVRTIEGKPTSLGLGLAAFVAAALLFVPVLHAGDKAALGELLTEPPTYICLGFQWQGTGDDNENATATLSYRKVGTEAWKEAMPLVRLLSNPIEPKVLFAGSIIDLEPDTEYECKLTASDPDGIKGKTEKIVHCRTRAEVVIPEGLKVRRVYPLGHTGPVAKEGKNYYNLPMAIWDGHMYNYMKRKREGAWANGGDMILLHAGVHKGKRLDKRRPYLRLTQSGLHGFPLQAQGTADRPLVIKAVGDGEVIIDGDGMPELFDLRGASHVIIEGITFQNAEMLLHLSDEDDAKPSTDITIRNCTFRDFRFAVCGTNIDNRNVTISDCRMVGRQQAVIGAWGYCSSNWGAVRLTGKGHVFRYNRVIDVFDFFNVSGPRSGAVDAYNNDIQRAGDNAMSSQVFSQNCRFLRNRIFNGGDPQLDMRNQVGPAYFIRNVVYNQGAGNAFKNNGGLGGIVALHNTITGLPFPTPDYRSGRLYNNLFMDSGKPGKGAWSLDFRAENCALFDYNGYLTKGAKFFIDKKPCTDFADFRKKSGLEAHGVEVDYSIFEKAIDPRSLPRERPHLIPLIDPATVDLRLKEGCPAVNAGKVIANVNENFTGKAPDLGAYERGKPVPHYGPRHKFPEPYRMQEPGKELAGPMPKAPGKAVIRVNCGCPADYEDPAGNLWHADQQYIWPNTWGYVGNPNSWHDQRRVIVGYHKDRVNKPVQNTALTMMYRWENGDVFSYHFKVDPGAYIVRLHFAERWRSYTVNISVNGKLALKELDVVKEAGGLHRALYRDIPCQTETGLISIDFAPKGKPNGIEIFTNQK
jgi:malectin (di-glucose binding ER protein)